MTVLLPVIPTQNGKPHCWCVLTNRLCGLGNEPDRDYFCTYVGC
jgi:hypothetical protein